MNKCNTTGPTGSFPNISTFIPNGGSLNLGTSIRKIETVYFDLRKGETAPVHYIDLESMECDPPEDTSLCSQCVRLCIHPAKMQHNVSSAVIAKPCILRFVKT